VLPALAAALVGAVTAGAATLISAIDAPSSEDAAQVALSAADAQNRHGGLSRPDNRMAQGSSGSADQGRGDTDSTSKDAPASSDAPEPSSSTGPARTRESETSIPHSSEPAQGGVEDEVVDLVNGERARAGCDPLTMDPKLAQAAQDHSTDMAERDYFDHTTPEGLTFADRIVNAGYPTPGAENIAVGQQNADQVMDGWMNSDGHRANILNCDLKSIGVGLAEDGMYWTQDFGY
jgi:uncharacterized protein YkwD